jgi:hypothetical protein
MRTYLLAAVGAIGFGVFVYLLYYAILWAMVWLLGIDARSITYDQRLCIEDLGYWFFILGSLIGAVCIGDMLSIKTKSAIMGVDLL